MTAKIMKLQPNATIHDMVDLTFACGNQADNNLYSLHKQGPVWALRRNGQEVRCWPNLIAGLSALERYSGHSANEFTVTDLVL